MSVVFIHLTKSEPQEFVGFFKISPTKAIFIIFFLVECNTEDLVTGFRSSCSKAVFYHYGSDVAIHILADDSSEKEMHNL